MSTTEERQLNILENSEIDPAERPFLHPGKWWHAEDDKIVCDLCPRECVLKPGDRGFCFVRQNIDGQMMLTTYGRSTGFCIDPIEKKPLNHFYPGTSVLSFGTAGCNLGCKFCQNWDISKSREIARLSERAWPEDIARAANALGCKSVAFTYNDPVIWAEYAIETARACRAAGIKAVAVTAGYITETAREDFYSEMDAANVDLKAFEEEFYYKLTLSHLQPVLDTLRWLKHETDVWFEITNLIIPQSNDNTGEFQRMCDWILENVGDEVPVHFTAFHPDFRMRDRGPTPPETLIAAREIALATGLKYVYTGNVNDVTRQSTYCPNCHKVVIERNWYELGEYNLDGSNCRSCGARIAGHFDEEPGDWGRQRQPVDMRQFASARRETPPAPAVQKPLSNDAETKPKQGAGMTTSTLPLPQLTDEQSAQIVKAAGRILKAASLERSLEFSPAELFSEEHVELAQHPVSGVFVTAKRGGHLRSCCGNLGVVMPLFQSLMLAAVRTATDDPRFPRISGNELPHLDLDVWLLGPPEEIAEEGEDRIAAVTIGRHGLQVVRGPERGLLLPGVAIEHGWEAEEFLNRTCLKAGLPATAWRDEETKVFRFEGSEHAGKVLSDEETADWPLAPPLFSPRDVAAYAQFCGETLRTLMQGATPLYYCPSVSDGNVNGVSLRVSLPGIDQELVSTRLNLRETMPLQSTMFSLCEELARVLANHRIPPNEVNVSMTVLTDPNMHGTAGDPDLAGIADGDRAILVAEGTRRAWVFDDEKTVGELFQEAIALCEIDEPGLALVMSLRVMSSHSHGQVVDRPRSVTGPPVRPPAVAGTFYPDSADDVNQMLDEMLPANAERSKWTAAMVPHAGWVYSGRIAGDVLAQIEFPKTVLIIGPKHTPHGVDWAVAPYAKWALPTGELESDRELAKQLAERIPGLKLDAAAHQAEHGIEVELPLIHRLASDTKIVGITIGGGRPDQLNTFAEKLAEVIAEMDEPPLLIISSDMNHFATDAENRRLDGLALAELDNLDPDALYQTCTENHISMCGMRPAVIVLKTLAHLGKLTQSRRVAYATSADVSGEKSRVVGYAGMLFR